MHQRPQQVSCPFYRIDSTQHQCQIVSIYQFFRDLILPRKKMSSLVVARWFSSQGLESKVLGTTPRQVINFIETQRQRYTELSSYNTKLP